MATTTTDARPLTPIPVSRSVGVPVWRVPSRSLPGHQEVMPMS